MSLTLEDAGRMGFLAGICMSFSIPEPDEEKVVECALCSKFEPDDLCICRCVHSWANERLSQVRSGNTSVEWTDRGEDVLAEQFRQLLREAYSTAKRMNRSWRARNRSEFLAAVGARANAHASLRDFIQSI